MICATCGHENAAGQKFCGECGSQLTAVCTSCGTPNPPGQRFCGQCGAALTQPAPVATTPAATPSPAAERRLVSVLFADLVGFTAASEDRDAEETRELLSRYFDQARTLIERYGGTVEKFIGDAVMAVWGTPVAQEDDAERAVRAALDLVAAVPQLHPALTARAGVLTGEAAVTLGAEGQGMVAGDLVNTASRIQSAAEPGSVLVGESTRRASEAAIAYENAGEHELRGRAELVRLSRALRVVANRGGERRSEALEPPFVGRERELRMVKELFHGSAAEGKAHFVLVTGIAGIGKSRLAWEFEKYADGLTLTVWWHRGRCPAYGDGVAYWALAEMVRGRAGIVESEDSDAAMAKLAAAVERHMIDPRDREWVEPRLGHLLGRDEGSSYQRDDLFAAWRFFFESLADENPVALVFEDLQWADAGLLDFIEYLLEWARSKPIFVIGLTRPELAERRPAFGASGRGFTALALEPLAPEAMEELLEGLVPGLPEELHATIRERSEGVPLYAVETVRMLLDRGQLERADGAYRVVGEIETLAVPETLHALVASRLDGLTGDERGIVQDASVLGKTFTRATLAAVSGQSEEDLEQVLQRLVRKEILFLEADPRSPERGQYGFLQDLVRHVAYETLARRDRKARHLAAAAFFEGSWGGREQEIVEVVASHYLTALELEPEAPDALELREHARGTLTRAGERAASLGASAEAAASFSRAAELTDSPVEQGRLLARAGNAARATGESERATELFTRAIALLEDAGETHAAARASADLGHVEFTTGRLDEAIGRMEAAFAVLERDDPDEDLAFFAAQLARFHFFHGNVVEATERNELALEIAEALRLPEVLAHALSTAGILANSQGRREQARALIAHGLRLALEHDLPGPALRGYANLSVNEIGLGNMAEAHRLCEQAVELARRVGDRESEWFQLGNVADCRLYLGDWDEIVELGEELEREKDRAGANALALFGALAEVGWRRGDTAEARRWRDALPPKLESSVSAQDRATAAVVNFFALMAEGRYGDALAQAEKLLDDPEIAVQPLLLEFALVLALQAAGTLDDLDRVEELVERLESRKPGELSPWGRAQAALGRARVASKASDEPRAEAALKTAGAIFREYGFRFWLGVALLEQAEWLTDRGRTDEATALHAEAREIFERLGAQPWLERAERIGRPAQVRA